MNKRTFFVLAGAAMGVMSVKLLKNRQALQARTLAWRQKQVLRLDLLACPSCHAELKQVDDQLACTQCQTVYPIVAGLPYFIEQQELTGLNRRFSRLYDWFSWGYRAFSKAAFAYIGMSEEEARREVTDRLDPQGGPVLEVSIGPGVNLPYLVDRPDISTIAGLDISPGQLHRCQEFAASQDWAVQLHLGTAEALPYPDNTFAGVFHIGGINFFNDKQRAISEMIRVAQPGARILICDENEKGAQAYERVLPGFKHSFKGQRQAIVPPIDLVPPTMQEIKLYDIWKGWLYCIEFRKSNLDQSSEDLPAPTIALQTG